MKAIHRLFQYFDYKQIKPTRFEKDHGLSNGYLGIQLKREADIGTSILKTIIDNCHDLSITWLITGKGNMLMEESHKNSSSNKTEFQTLGTSNQQDCEKCKIKEVFLESLHRHYV